MNVQNKKRMIWASSQQSGRSLGGKFGGESLVLLQRRAKEEKKKLGYVGESCIIKVVWWVSYTSHLILSMMGYDE